MVVSWSRLGCRRGSEVSGLGDTEKLDKEARGSNRRMTKTRFGPDSRDYSFLFPSQGPFSL